MNTQKPRVLVLTTYFLPGSQGGGLVRAVANIVEHLRHEFDFVVATSAYDCHAQQPYTAQQQDKAQAAAGVDIRYLPRGKAMLEPMRRLMAERWDLIYLNSSLSRGFTALPLLLLRLQGGKPPPILLAPRGELMAGALQHRRAKKLVYLKLTGWLGMFRGVSFHATSAEDAAGIRAIGWTQAPVLQAGDLPPATVPELATAAPFATAPLRIAFLSRIDPKKNLLFALNVLAQVRIPVELEIIGPIGNEGYWQQCQQLIATLPAHVQVRYLGPIPHEQVLQAFSRHELFLFPTLAENNGYVILEALLAGCALVLSDRTPWRGLAQAGVGEDLPLDDMPAFVAAINAYSDLSVEAKLERRQRAQQFGRQRLNASGDVQATAAMFRQVLARSSA